VIEKILTHLGLQSRVPPCSPGSGQAACSAWPCGATIHPLRYGEHRWQPERAVT
jgi:hypothetical protein